MKDFQNFVFNSKKHFFGEGGKKKCENIYIFETFFQDFRT